MNNIRRFARYY